MLLRVTPAIAIEDRHLRERFVRSSGPGGQNVNKVATAVELRFDLAGSGLPEAVKARLRRLAGSRLAAGDVLVIEAREHRTQAQNRQVARRRLVALVRRAARRPVPRRATRPTAASRRARMDAKRRRAKVKRSRSTPGDAD